jgi:hypothetical protein
MWAESKSEQDMRVNLDRLGDSFRSIRDEVEHEREQKAHIGAILNAVGQTIGPDAEVSS